MMWSNGMGWGGWLLMALTTIGFWALVVFGVVALFRGTRPGRPDDPDGRGHRAEQILDERFARGEIDADEYRARQSALHARR
ncbi:SHOCT domain-containing protein [Oryzobacter sp. R7]|uniref:SHOCT domain-containing protein n=1 Tax=Oryzobacter faecalis TaxID=3388656 RepID=UPI00398C9E44